MRTLKETIRNLGLDGWIFALTGVAAIIFGVLSFLGLLPFDEKQTLSIVIGALGLLMAAVVAQTARRHAEISELKNALGITEAELLGSNEFGLHLASSVAKSKNYVLDTLLTSAIPRLTTSYGFSGSQAEFHRLLYERVIKGDITFRYVTVIFHRQRLQDIVFKLLLHEGSRFYIRHYEPPPTAIPIINLMSFDDEAFYLGGFYTKSEARETPVLFIREPHLTQILKNYWNSLWDAAIPLNEGGIINWTELKRIGEKVGMSKDEFEAMKKQMVDEAHSMRKQLRRR